MDEFIRKVYERGKVTIPKELRDLYNVQDGDFVRFKIVDVVSAADRARRAKPGAKDDEDGTFEAEVA